MVTLIARQYLCDHGCMYITSDFEFVERLPACIPFPFVLFQRSGMTTKLNDMIISKYIVVILWKVLKNVEPNSIDYTRPTLLIWDPPGQYVTVFQHGFPCLKHPDKKLQSGNFQNSKGMKPRQVYHISEMVTLIARQYLCDHGCMYITSNLEFVERLPACIPIPFVLFQRSGMTTKLNDTIIAKIYSGDIMESVEKHLYDIKHTWQCSYKKQYWNHAEWYDTGLCTTH